MSCAFVFAYAKCMFSNDPFNFCCSCVGYKGFVLNMLKNQTSLIKLDEYLI